MDKRFIARARRIRLALFDVDGVLTDGSLLLSRRGEELKQFNIQDGLGLKMLGASGVGLGLISGRKSAVVTLRARETGIAHVLQGVGDKLQAYRRLLKKLRLAEEETSYMGDDLPDIAVLKRCGLAFSVPDAPEIVRAHAHCVTRRPGGRGAVREVCEYLLRAQNNLNPQMAPFLP